MFANIPFDIINSCRQPGPFEWFALAVSGGVITGLFQLASDAIGLHRIKTLYKECLEKLENEAIRSSELENCEKKVAILQAKIEMYAQVGNDSPCDALIKELLKEIQAETGNESQ